MNQIIKYIILYIIGLPVIVFLSCLDGSMSVHDLFNAHYLLTILIGYHAVWACVLYFCQINPRRFIALTAWKTHVVSGRWIAMMTGFVFFVLAWIGGLFSLGILVKPMSLKVILLVSWMIAFFVGLYFLFYRGIGIYKNGKIRVFQYGITTIRNGKIEDMTVEPCGKRAILHIRISDAVYDFRLPSDVAQLACEKIAKTLADIQYRGFTID